MLRFFTSYNITTLVTSFGGPNPTTCVLSICGDPIPHYNITVFKSTVRIQIKYARILPKNRGLIARVHIIHVN